jgi:hypothetical protein
MNILHHISANIDADTYRRLRSLGVDPWESVNRLGVERQEGHAIFGISESHPSWVQILQLIIHCRPVGFAKTEFSRRELTTAQHLEVTTPRPYGYPEPQDDFYVSGATYDTTSYCSKCGSGKKQIGPFRLKAEPKCAKKDVFQLNWVHDEFFVRSDIWERVFQSMGFGSRPVLHHRTGKTLETVVQLEIKEIAPCPLHVKTEVAYKEGRVMLDITEGVLFEQCDRCGEKKYHSIVRGFFPPFTYNPKEGRAWRTQEIFGTGSAAWNGIIISKGVFDAIEKHHLRGFQFIPMEPTAGIA